MSPMYEYLCSRCEAIHDVMVSLDEKDKELECPDCDTKLIKLLSMPNFKVK
jgi:putative FmdB family regulatory protein